MIDQATNSNLARHLKNYTCKEIAESLSPQTVCEVMASLKLSFRNRIFNPFVTLFAFLSQVFDDDSSCRQAVASTSLRLLARQGKSCSLGTSSLCKAKARLPVAFYEEISKRIAIGLESQREDQWTWRHGNVKLVDGTGLSMPDTAANQKKFPRAKGASFPVVRLLGVFSLATGGFIGGALSAWSGKGVGELTLLRQLWNHFDRGDTLLGDGLYANYWVLASALERGVGVVAEFNKRSWGRINRKNGDQIIEIKKPVKPKSMNKSDYAQIPGIVRVRIVKLCCAPKGFRVKTKFILTTHLSSKEISADEILSLYKKRWQVELHLRSIKTLLGMDILKGQGPDMVQKEIWTHLIAYNLIRIKMLQIGRSHKKPPINFSFRATQQVLSLLRQVASLGINIKEIEPKLLELLSIHTIGKRPDRFEPRAIKRRKKNFALLKGPRDAARRKLHKKYKVSKNTGA